MNRRFFAGLLIAAATLAPASAQTRQQIIRERSAHVMPFSMDSTMHQFEPTSYGGFVAITVHSSDAQQLALVRAHLQREAAAFARGDYSDPAYIHGKAMPGLAELSAGAKRIAVRYSQVDGGARIDFRTSDPRLIAALHRWFAAQVSDHGHDAMM